MRDYLHYKWTGIKSVNEYDFSRLNDKEFEVFCTDLLSSREKLKFERFKPGRDGGVDGRYFKPDGSEWILQCKHWATSPLGKLIKHMKDEVVKVRILAPARYFLAVSHSLSRRDKNHLKEIFSPYILSTHDILGREDLNDILSKNPTIERRHFKLWLNSTNVLVHLLNKPIIDRSNSVLDDIIDLSKIYAPTSNHYAALNKLKSMGTVIITGPAGIGKTTLAEQLILQYAIDGYELVCIDQDIKEAEGVFDQESKQIFYFDDFLGRNYLEALSGHEGGQIIQFIKRVLKHRNKRFILTSRTTILNQGKILNDVFENNNINRNEFEITLESLAQIDKAHILYNHIWHSQLNPEYVEELYIEKRYRKVIEHKNFNPRLIRFITDSHRLDDITHKDYWTHTLKSLNNPSKVWEHPFTAQLDDFGRALVLLVAFNGRNISQSKLSEAFTRLLMTPGLSQFNGKRDFIISLRHLTGSMLTRFFINDTEPYLKLFNPSLGDFLIHHYCQDMPTLRNYFTSLQSASALEALRDMALNNFINTHSLIEIVSFILMDASEKSFIGIDLEYIAKACNIIIREKVQINQLNKIMKKAVEIVLENKCPRLFFDSADFLCWATKNNLIDIVRVEQFALEACDQDPTADEIEKLSTLIGLLAKSGQEEASKKFEEALSQFLIDGMHDEFPDNIVFDGCSNAHQARANLEQLVSDRIDSLGVINPSSLVDSVVSSFNLETRMEKYFYYNAYEPEMEHRREWPSERIIGHIDLIDDLFSRN